MQLRPGETFSIVRQLDDPYDSGTYYVQAIVRDANTDSVIATLNLVNKGSQRFTKSWQVVADPSGMGRYIDVQTLVYTDSGYTTVSEQYRRENKVYLVLERKDNIPGNGGGSDISYKTIEKIITTKTGDSSRTTDKNLKKAIAPVLKMLEKVAKNVEVMCEPEEESDDEEDMVLQAKEEILSKIGSSTDEIKTAISEIPKQEPVDLSEVMNKLDEMALPELKKELESFINKGRELLGSDIVKMNEQLNNIVDAIKNISFTVPAETYKAKLPIEEAKPETGEEQSQR